MVIFSVAGKRWARLRFFVQFGMIDTDFKIEKKVLAGGMFVDFLGMDDDAFIRRNVPMTKQEIRILSLVKARIKPDAVIYDIGAGTGSLSVEAARLAPHGTVYALERTQDGVSLIRANADKFMLPNVKIIAAEAPEGMELLPKADTVLIGGSGSKLREILDTVTLKLKDDGRIVLN